MKNSQIPSSDLVKITFFLVLQIPFFFLVGWGIVPAIILLTGFFISKRDKKEGPLKISISLCRYYIYLTVIIILAITIYISMYDEYYKSEPFNYVILPMFGFLSVPIIYLLILEFLYNKPMINNILYIMAKKKKDDLSILKTENMKSYSVADELLKWKELKDSGLISEKDFEEMKKKIMGS